MNESTETMIRELADKLGTTSEYLFGVLVKQAPISSLTDLAVLSIWGLAVWLGFKAIRKNSKVPPATEEEEHPRSNWGDDAISVALTVWGVFTFFFLLISGLSITLIVSGIFNPEYWALKQLLP